MNIRRMMAKKAYQQALHYATTEEDKENCEYCLDRLENPTLQYDPVEDSDACLSVIDEVESADYMKHWRMNHDIWASVLSTGQPNVICWQNMAS